MKTLLLILAVQLSSCTYQDNREIVYYTGCSNIEAQLDLERSVSLLKNSLSSENILITHNRDSSFCGYKFIDGSKNKILKGAVTDYDLAVELEEFFDVQILDK